MFHNPAPLTHFIFNSAILFAAGMEKVMVPFALPGDIGVYLSDLSAKRATALSPTSRAVLCQPPKINGRYVVGATGRDSKKQ
jgi:hypothetical protein